MSAAPTVSTIIAAYNAAPFVERALESALAQSGVEQEILVVDDASTDATVETVKKYALGEDRIKVIRNPVNGGPARARNLAMEQARGQWIAVLDSDDGFAPGRLASMIEQAEQTGADIVIDDFVSVDPEGAVLDSGGLSQRRSAGYLGLEDWVALNALGRAEVSFGYAKPLFSKVFLDRAQVRYNETLRNGEDYHLILESLCADATLYFTGVPGYNYTRRPGSVSRKAKDAHMRALLDADDTIAARLDPQTQASTKHLFALRRQNILNLMTTEAVLHKLKSRQLLGALSGLMSNPRATGRVMGHLGEAVAKRVGTT